MITLKRQMNKKIIDKFYSKIIGTFLAFLAIVLFIITFAEICSRYLLNTSLIWPEELARYLGIWITFIGISIGIRENVHVNLEFAVKKLPQKIGKWIVVARNGGICLFFIYLTYLGFKFVKTGMDRLTLSLHFPIGYIYLALPIGSVLALIALVWEIFLLLHNEEDHSK